MQLSRLRSLDQLVVLWDFDEQEMNKPLHLNLKRELGSEKQKAAETEEDQGLVNGTLAEFYQLGHIVWGRGERYCFLAQY
jgi:hypothetical protein